MCQISVLICIITPLSVEIRLIASRILFCLAIHLSMILIFVHWMSEYTYKRYEHIHMDLSHEVLICSQVSQCCCILQNDNVQVLSSSARRARTQDSEGWRQRVGRVPWRQKKTPVKSPAFQEVLMFLSCPACCPHMSLLIQAICSDHMNTQHELQCTEVNVSKNAGEICQMCQC